MEDSQLSKQCGPFWADVERENLKRMKRKTNKNKSLELVLKIVTHLIIRTFTKNMKKTKTAKKYIKQMKKKHVLTN